MNVGVCWRILGGGANSRVSVITETGMMLNQSGRVDAILRETGPEKSGSLGKKSGSSKDGGTGVPRKRMGIFRPSSSGLKISRKKNPRKADFRSRPPLKNLTMPGSRNGTSLEKVV